MKRFVVTAAVRLIAAGGLFYSGLQFAISTHLGTAFGIASLLFIPVGIWLGALLVASLRAMANDEALVFESAWEEFRGPRSVYLLLYALGVVGFGLLLGNHQLRYGDSSHLSRISPIAWIAALWLGANATLWVIVSAAELRWGIGREKQTGKKLYSRVVHQS